MTVRKWICVLLAQVLVAVSVVLLFKTFPHDKRLAGLLAGSLFLSLGGLTVWLLVKRGRHWRSLTFYAAAAHLLASSLPMVIYRLIYWSQDFTQIRIWGLPGPVFHYWAQKIYVAMMVATILDLAMTWWERRRIPAESSAEMK